MPARTAVYLDLNASSPLHPDVQKGVEAAFSRFRDLDSPLCPNPSSVHSHGQAAKAWLNEARDRVARSLGSKVDSEQLVFTSSGTEANQIAIRSVLEPLLLKGEKPHWILTQVEHDSVLQMVPWAESQGARVSFLKVNSSGLLEVSELEKLATPDTALVSVVWVNNETGVISPVSAISQVTRSRRIPLHLDAAQAWGKIPFDLEEQGAQYVTFSGHKIGAYPGIGVIWAQPGNPIRPLIYGKQEKGRRGGTENVPGILSLGIASQAISGAKSSSVGSLRDRLQNAICDRIPGVLVNGAGSPRVPGTLNVCFDGIEGEGLVLALDLAGYSVSAGSACSSGALEPSHVLLAMGRSKAQAISAIRVSIAEGMSWELLEGFVTALEKVVTRCRASSARWRPSELKSE